ncbi:MAG: tryptophan--tRNA ligase [Thermodesulfobacteriota bacterium]|jgi:tryptophanyl-tRNA synthetase|nr:MAG: tryptophan--tRNA ligase [Thermodesulfobacteriota bacterium]
MSSKQRVVSGMRPTGKLHLGHYYGALKNWGSLQDTYECFYFVADWHALTTEYAHPQIIKESIHDMVIDWLALGIQIPKSTIFIQSSLPEHAELYLLLSMITPLSWLERNPTYKEQEQELKDKDIHTHGFLGYPVLQAADILIYKAHKVPVGIDQVPHLELTREIGRRFNFLYREIFPLPDALLTETPKILGIDGRKMSKSYNNALFLSDPPEIIKEKVSQMFTDPNRKRKTDPGNPDICNVYTLHKLYSHPDDVAIINRDCRVAEIGCVECKKKLTPYLVEFLAPIQERREYYARHREAIDEILAEGNKRAQGIARQNLKEAREAMGI